MADAPETKRKQVWLSVSGADTWASCQRRWYYEKVEGRKEGASDILAQGSLVHACLEGFLLNGAWPDDPELEGRSKPADWDDERVAAEKAAALDLARLGEQSIASLRVLPGRQVIEHTIRIGKGDDRNPFALPYYGAVDFAYQGQLPAALAPHIGLPPMDDLRLVVDHKTTGNLSGRWLKKADELNRDPQMVLYGALLWGGDKPDPFHVAHHRYQTTRKGKKPAHRVIGPTAVPWAHAEDTLGAFVEQSRIMEAATRADRAEDIPANPRHCRAYGRLCPHAELCADSPANREAAVSQAAIRALLAKVRNPITTSQPREEVRMTLAEKLAAKRAAARGEPAATPDPARAPEPTTPEPAQATPADAPPGATPTAAMVTEAARALKLTAESGIPLQLDWVEKLVGNIGLPVNTNTIRAVCSEAGVDATALGLAPPRAGETPSDEVVPVAEVPAAAPAPVADPTPDPTNTQEAALLKVAETMGRLMEELGRKGIKVADAKKVAGPILGVKAWSGPKWADFVKAGEAEGLWVVDGAWLVPYPHTTPAPAESAAETPESAAETSAESAPAPVVDNTNHQAPVSARFVLVGVHGRGIQAVHLLEVLVAMGIPQAVAAEKKVGDWRLVDYGDGAKLIASKLTVALRDGASLPPIIYVEAHSDLAAHVVQVLDAAGWVVLRGER